MNNPKNVEVIMRDGSTALASEVMDTLIASAVTNAIIENRDEFDLSKRSDIKSLSGMIADHLEMSTNISVKPETVIAELERQLK